MTGVNIKRISLTLKMRFNAIHFKRPVVERLTYNGIFFEF